MKIGEYEINNIYNEDCYIVLKSLPDKCVDLVLTDPPYGINADKGTHGFGSSPLKVNKYDDSWDFQTPNKELFDELIRIGKKVIIFGGNYFTDKLSQSNHWIVWDKTANISFKNPFSDCELVWTNFEKNLVKKYTVIQQGFINSGDERVHPTQKPLKLIKEILNDYSKEEDIVLDCFLGSGTTAVACKELGRNYIGFEINKKYFEIAKDRLKGITKEDREKREAGQLSLEDFM